MGLSRLRPKQIDWAYRLPQLPGGIYQVSADLPPNIEIAGILGSRRRHSSCHRMPPRTRYLCFPNRPDRWKGDRTRWQTGLCGFRPSVPRRRVPGRHAGRARLPGPKRVLRVRLGSPLHSISWYLETTYWFSTMRRRTTRRAISPNVLSARCQRQDAQLIHLVAGQQISDGDIRLGHDPVPQHWPGRKGKDE
jgi:hypothetical protein